MKHKIKKILRPLAYISIACGVFLFSAFFVVYSYFPGVLDEARTRVSFYRANLEVKTVSSGPYTFEYVDGGKGDPILFVHGFGGQKRSWVKYCKKLSSKYRVIAVDLPGHGGTPHPQNQHYDLDSLTEALHSFTDAIELEKFHLIGLSMGGGVSTVYAAKYPDHLLSLTLMNPFGVVTPERSDVEKGLMQGKNLFFPKTISELDELVSYTTGKPLNIAKHFKEYLLQKMNEKRAFFAKAFDELANSTPVESLLPKIKTKTLLLIGGKDRIIHPSSIKIYQKLLPNVSSRLIQHGTHVFVGPFFDEAYRHIESFLQAP